MQQVDRGSRDLLRPLTTAPRRFPHVPVGSHADTRPTNPQNHEIEPSVSDRVLLWIGDQLAAWTSLIFWSPVSAT